MGPPAKPGYRDEKAEEPLIKGLGDVVAKDFNCPLSMHNTGCALATQWDVLLGYYCQARGWHWKTADAVGRMPAGRLVSSQLRAWGSKGPSAADPSPLPLQPSSPPQQAYRWPLRLCNLRSLPGQVFWVKNLKQTDNPQVGPVYPKVKEQAKANSLFSLQSSPHVLTREDNNRLWLSLSNHSFIEVSDGTGDNALQSLSASFLCHISQLVLTLVNTQWHWMQTTSRGEMVRAIILSIALFWQLSDGVISSQCRGRKCGNYGVMLR